MQPADPLPPPPARPRRRFPGLAMVAGTALIAIAAAGGYWLHQRTETRRALVAAYDLDTAMNLAGSQVPPEVESFYFFVLEQTASGETSELADKLRQAAEEHDFLGITGADPEHNRAVLLAALAVPRNRSLSGLILIYVGPAEQEAELAPFVHATGAEFRFVPYTPPAAESI